MSPRIKMKLDIVLMKIKRFIPRKIFLFLQPAYHFVLSYLSALLYRFPGDELIVIGVTGTTGKTTSVYLIAKTLEESGYKVGFTSTAMFNDGQREWLNDKKMTMVGRMFTQKILRRMVNNGCHYAIVETTSEGIAQFRHRFINYDVLVFTCLYPEHIESHGNFENYKKAKGKLFFHLGRCRYKYADKKRRIVKSVSGIKKIDLDKIKKVTVLNGDDEYWEFFREYKADKRYIYAQNNVNFDLRKNEELINYGMIKAEARKTEFLVNKNKFVLSLLGKFNISNAMTAIGVGLSQNIKIDEIKNALGKISGVAGRLEKIDEGQDFTVIVDYAFEPRAIEKLYETVSLIPHNKIIHVLGSAGGGRDVSRRPILGGIAGAKADLVIITNEDPYDDDPEIIIDQVSLGAEKAGKKLSSNLFKITDRREAIKKALDKAEKNDIVLITGKGSEQAICVAGGEKITWDDRAVVRGILQNFKKTSAIDN